MLAGCVLIVVWIAIWNYNTLAVPLAELQNADPKIDLTFDPRCSDVDIAVHYQYYILPSVLVFDVKKIPERATACASEVLKKFAIKLRGKDFKLVQLAYKGHVKFLIRGKDFKKIDYIVPRSDWRPEDKDKQMEELLTSIAEGFFALDALRRPDGTKAYQFPYDGTYMDRLAESLSTQLVFNREWFGDDRSAEMLAQNIQPEPTFELPAASVPLAEVQQPVAPSVVEQAPDQYGLIAASDPLAVAALQKRESTKTVVAPPPVPVVESKSVVIESPKATAIASVSAKPAIAAKPVAPVAVIVPAPVVAQAVVSAPPVPPAAPAIAPQPPPVQVAVAPKEPSPPAPIVKAEPAKIRIHYFRADGNYQPWSVHAWEPDMQELTGGWMNQAHFQKLDDYGAVFEIDPSRLSTKQVGFIIRRGEAKDCDADREWNISKSLEVWTVSNSCAMYYDKAKALSTIRRL